MTDKTWTAKGGKITLETTRKTLSRVPTFVLSNSNPLMVWIPPEGLTLEDGETLTVEFKPLEGLYEI